VLEVVKRCNVEKADNGGVIVRIWEGGKVEPQRGPERYDPVSETFKPIAIEPQALIHDLKNHAKELPGPVPTLAEIKAWPEADLLAVSQWVRAVHAHAHPIAGMVLPEVPDQPSVLFEFRAEPAPKAAKARKKRTRVEKGSLADRQHHGALARDPEEDQPDPRERPGQGP
jgi:hypothetical protein